jgi:putative flippase GtrA
MQFILYLIVGGLSFFVELAAFIGLRSASVAVIPASVTSFIIATIANYLLSIALALVPGRFRRGAELARFLGVVLVGLGLNTLVVWVLAYPLAIPPVVAKVSAVPIVLVWNYLGRRLFVFDARVPTGIAALVELASRARPALPEEAALTERPSVRFARTVNRGISK